MLIVWIVLLDNLNGFTQMRMTWFRVINVSFTETAGTTALHLPVVLNWAFILYWSLTIAFSLEILHILYRYFKCEI